MLNPQIFFLNDDHRAFFASLLVHFHAADREYSTACYVLAHPEIYRKVRWVRCENPFDFTKWRGKDRVDLSNGFRLLVDMAANLFNDRNKFNLMDALSTWDENNQRVFYQALDIRLGKIGLANGTHYQGGTTDANSYR